MNDFVLNIPIVFVIFKRLDTTQKVFQVIREIKPKRLYILADAAKKGNEADAIKVQSVRKYVEEGIDWDCEVYKNYASENMGSQQRIVTGLNWVFRQEESAIILEDDVVPEKDFFQFCQELLEYHKENTKVMMISGTNLIKNYTIEDSYTYSCFSSIWGWATWRRAWEKMDVEMRHWPSDKKSGKIRYVANPLSYLWIEWNLEYTYRKEIDAWDFPWGYARHRNHGLGIVPKKNLVENIGMNHIDALHMHGEVIEEFEHGYVEFPLKHPNEIKRNLQYDKLYIKKNYNPWKAWIEWNRKAVCYVFRRLKKLGKKS